jgi:hypothetical protein
MHIYNKDKIFIAPHFGLGDSIICNSIYRHFAKKFSIVLLPVFRDYVPSVRRMLMDLPNIILLPYNRFFAQDILKVHKKFFENAKIQVLNLGTNEKGFREKGRRENIRFDEGFFQQAGVEFENRWNNFNYTRIIEKERALFDELGCQDGNYQFVHEDLLRKFVIDRKYLNPNLRIVCPTLDLKNVSIFDYRQVFENATEIHCIESSFAALIESLDVSVPKFAHRYARPEARNDFQHEFTYKSRWKIL